MSFWVIFEPGLFKNPEEEQHLIILWIQNNAFLFCHTFVNSITNNSHITLWYESAIRINTLLLTAWIWTIERVSSEIIDNKYETSNKRGPRKYETGIFCFSVSGDYLQRPRTRVQETNAKIRAILNQKLVYFQLHIKNNKDTYTVCWLVKRKKYELSIVRKSIRSKPKTEKIHLLSIVALVLNPR